MRLLPLLLFYIIGISTAQGQNSSFYAGLSSYLSSKYVDASSQFAQSLQTSEPQHKTDIYYLNGLCLYFQRDYRASLQHLDSAVSYYRQYPKDAGYYKYEDLQRYRALNYEKLGDRKNEITVLKQMLRENKSKWARERLNSPRLSSK